MDIYGISTPDYFRIDDLLDFSNDDLFSTCTSSSIAPADHISSPPQNPMTSIHNSAPFIPALDSTDLSDHLSLPSDDVAELEWLSQFVDDSFIDFPPNSLTGTINVRSDTSFSGKAALSKRSRVTTNNVSKKETSNTNRSLSPMSEGGIRRCTHCASEKTPQWRTGPLGPKTLCNACGVRYKSGRLVPEYRPAASPTFVLTQHSNSHRKVMELRRQKEMLRQQLEEPSS